MFTEVNWADPKSYTGFFRFFETSGYRINTIYFTDAFLGLFVASWKNQTRFVC
jgi:hypothetical protein